MNPKQLAVENYQRFSNVEGNDYIASEYAIELVLRLIKDFNVQSVLEIGLGIGSISDSILKYASANNLNVDYVGTEANEFCLQALPKNVGRFDAIRLYRELAAVEDRKFDLIIVDGSDESLHEIKRFCTPDSVLFIEGFRGNQVNLIKQVFPNAIHAEIISSRRNPSYGPFPSEKWSGGGQLIFVEPDGYKRWYWFKQKARSFIVRRIRRFIK